MFFRWFISLVLLLRFALAARPGENGFPDFDIKHDSPTGDPSNKKDLHRFHSKLTFDNNVDVWKDVCGKSEKKLAQIAKDAYYQMTSKMVSLDMSVGNRPYVMTALPVGNTIYLSSSVKGGPFLLYVPNPRWGAYMLLYDLLMPFSYARDEHNPVYKELKECQAALTSLGWGTEIRTDHLNAASCGEMFALYAYFTENMDGDAKNRLKDQPIVTVRNLDRWKLENKKQELPYDNIVVFDPCGTDAGLGGLARAFGCFQVTRDGFGLKAVLETEDHNPADEFEDVDYSKQQFATSHVEINCILAGEQPEQKARL